MTSSRIDSSNMKKPRQLKIQTLQKATPRSWLEVINDDRLRLAIPVGPRFQADVPDWTGPPHQKYPCIGPGESDTSRWLGTQVWPIKGSGPESKRAVSGNGRLDAKRDVIGKGRADFCLCVSPGSVECIKRHVTDKRMQLQFDLGPAFWRWKFDEMGEEVSNLWNLEEQKKFESIVKMNPTSLGRSFLKPALECLPSQSKESIVSYYFNIFVPRRISMQTRSGCTMVDTDDEAPYSKCSQKRCRSDVVTSYTSKYVKTRYLTGRR